MKNTVLLLMVLPICVVAYAVDNRIKQTEMLYDGDATDPALYWGSEGETDTGEGEEDGWIHSPEGEKGIGWIVDNTLVGTVQSDGIHADTTGDISGGDITADTITMNEGEGEGVITGYFVGNLTGNTEGTHAGDVDGDDITADTITMNEGEGAIYPTDLEGIIWDEGEPERIYRSPEGEEGIGFEVDDVTVVTIQADGVHGDTAGAHTGAVSFPAGSAAAPSIYPTGDTDTGIYSEGANHLSFATDGTLRLSLDANGFSTTLPILAAAGADTDPSYTFTGTDGTGMYLSGTNTLGFSTNETLRLSLSTTALTSTLPLSLPDGAAATPALRFTSDPDSGIYASGANSVRIAIGGALAFTFASTGSTAQQYVTNYNTTAADPNFKSVANSGLYINTGTAAVGLSVGGISAIEYDSGTVTSSYSGATLTETQTNYYAGTAHNTLTLRAARGTSASADYLDTNDVVASTTYQSRDGDGTWGDTAAISVIATADHDAGETPGAIVLSATPEGSDTLTEVARAFVYDYFGFFDFPMLRTRMFNFYDSGNLDVALGYLGDIDSNLSGITMFNFDVGGIPMMLGTDGMFYSDILSGVYQGNTWRFGSDSNEHLDFDQYDYSGSSWETKMHHDGSGFVVDEGSVVVGAAEAVYLGDPDTDGTWRMIRDGDNMAHQRREAGTYNPVITVEDDRLVYNKDVYGSVESCVMNVAQGGTLPGITTLLDKDGDDTGISVREFDIDEKGSLAICLPGDYKEGTDIHPYIFWGSNDAPTGTDYVKWEITYCRLENGAVIPDALTTDVNAAYDTQYEGVVSAFTDINGTDYNAGDGIAFSIKRVTATGDAFAGEAWAISIKWVYLKDTPGSRTETAK